MNDDSNQDRCVRAKGTASNCGAQRRFRKALSRGGRLGVHWLLLASACTPPSRDYFNDDEQGGASGGSGSNAPGGSSGHGGTGNSTANAVAGTSVGSTAGNSGSLGRSGAPQESSQAGATPGGATIGYSGSTGTSTTPNPGDGGRGANGVGGTPATATQGGTSASEGGATEGGGGIDSGAAGYANVAGAPIDNLGGRNAGGANAFAGDKGVGGSGADGADTGNGGIANGGGSVGGALGRDLGQSCSVGAECSSLNCVDGVCCGESSCPECMNCGPTGQCNVHVSGQPDLSGKICSGSRGCDASGACKLAAGQGCSSDADCSNGFCTDRVCCRSRCNDSCQVCDNTGTCQPVLMREDDSCHTDATGARMCDALAQCSVPHLIKDVNPLTYGSGSNVDTYPSFPVGFTQGPDRRIYFSGSDGNTGDELWVTDGTSAGTVLVADILPGLGNGSPRGLVNASSNLFFAAVDSSGFAKLYATNGTAAGTRLVKDLGSTGFMYNTFSGRAAGNVIYFSGCSTESGCELWRSDGTNAGTHMVSDIMTTTVPGDATRTFGSNPGDLTVMSNVVYFRAASAVVGLGSTNTLADIELWRSDGTATNTVRVADLSPGMSNSTPTYLTALSSFVGPRLLFAASQGTGNQELYVADGSLGNVSSFDLNPGDASSAPGPFVTMGNRAYFTATVAGAGRELWITDGTRSGTFLVKDINPGAADGSPSVLTPGVGNYVYFQANDGTASAQLYRSDGTVNGTTKIFSSFVPTGAALFSMAPVGNWMFIATAGGLGSQELWMTNGTTAGTYRSCSDPSGLCGQTFPNNPSELRSIDGHMYFNATGSRFLGGTLGAEPFVYP
ncbi:MAG TPA: hypothetical protein VIV60_11310 [Polyangiaceae bacterium]